VRTNELEKIKEEVFNFYNNLLGIDRISDETINSYEFNIKSMNVDECVKNLINNEISVDEVERVINKIKESAPGSTGLTIGFYKKYFKYFGVYDFCLYDFYSTISSVNTRGVEIFIRKERGLKVLNEYFDNENRVHGIEVCFKNKNYNFINIYSPTSSYNQCEFIQNLCTLLNSKKNIFLGGDFNYIEDREYERNNNKLWKTFFKN
jgi:hypothetical protein